MTGSKAAEPKLRFRGNADGNAPIQSKSFEDIFVFSTGKNIKQAEAAPDFAIPCVRYGELYHLYDEVITTVVNRTNLDESELKFSEGDEILLPSAGEDPLDIGSASALMIKGVAIGRTINVLKPKDLEIYDQRFASYYINQKLRKKISKLARGASISNVYNSDLRKLNIHLPILPEQRKIADFLTAVDGRIEQLIQKKILLENYKKGVMQELFTQAICFKDDHGNDFPDWEEKMLGEVCELVGGLTYSPDDIAETGLLVLRSSNVQNGRVTFDDNVFVTTEVNEWNLSRPGDILVCVRNGSKRLIGKNARIPEECPRSTHGAFMTVLRGKTNAFLLHLLQTDDYKRNIHRNLGATINSINGSDLKKFKFIFPSSRDEETKIADFLSAIDRKIESVATQITETQTFKRGLLQQMFV